MACYSTSRRLSVAHLYNPWVNTSNCYRKKKKTRAGALFHVGDVLCRYVVYIYTYLRHRVRQFFKVSTRAIVRWRLAFVSRRRRYNPCADADINGVYYYCYSVPGLWLPVATRS